MDSSGSNRRRRNRTRRSKYFAVSIECLCTSKECVVLFSNSALHLRSLRGWLLAKPMLPYECCCFRHHLWSTGVTTAREYEQSHQYIWSRDSLGKLLESTHVFGWTQTSSFSSPPSFFNCSINVSLPPLTKLTRASSSPLKTSSFLPFQTDIGTWSGSCFFSRSRKVLGK